MTTRHAAVWLDHQEAKVFHIEAESADRSELHVKHHLHHQGKTGAHAETDRRIAADKPWFDDIAKHLADAEEILVVGPSNAKLEFVEFVKTHHKDLAKKIVGVEPADHPTDGQLVAHVRKYFLAADRMKG